MIVANKFFHIANCISTAPNTASGPIHSTTEVDSSTSVTFQPQRDSSRLPTHLLTLNLLKIVAHKCFAYRKQYEYCLKHSQWPNSWHYGDGLLNIVGKLTYHDAVDAGLHYFYFNKKLIFIFNFPLSQLIQLVQHVPIVYSEHNC